MCIERLFFERGIKLYKYKNIAQVLVTQRFFEFSFMLDY